MFWDGDGAGDQASQARFKTSPLGGLFLTIVF